MGPSRRDQCTLLIAVIRVLRLKTEASKSAITALWSGGVNVGARGHDAGHLSLLV